MDETPNESTPVITIGKVTMQVVGGEVVLRSLKAPGLEVRVPVTQLESWALRRLREELAA